MNLYVLPIAQNWDCVGRQWQSYLLEGKDLLILYSKYYGCWCPGDASRQGISNNGINLRLSEISGILTRRVENTVFKKTRCNSIVYALESFVSTRSS